MVLREVSESKSQGRYGEWQNLRLGNSKKQMEKGHSKKLNQTLRGWGVFFPFSFHDPEPNNPLIFWIWMYLFFESNIKVHRTPFYF